MTWFKQLFSKKSNKQPVPPIPPMEEIIEHLYGEPPKLSDGEMIRVIYSIDRTKRFFIFKSAKGFYKYTYEEICVYDELDWEYFAFVENAYPGWWEPKGAEGYSFFGTAEEALTALKSESTYNLYF